MFEPSKYKYRKAFKGRIKGKATSGGSVVFGSYALQADGVCRITAKQIEAARKTAMRSLKRKGKLWIRIFPNIPVSKKPADVRMGKGKGSVEMWVFRVKRGRMIFELEGVSLEQAREALGKAAAKLPISCNIVTAKYGGIR